MGFEYVKALHLIFIVTWFAGLFYIVRLFIYQTEALEKSEQERQILKPQLDLMARRLWYIITWPSAVLTLIFGFWVLTLPLGIPATGIYAGQIDLCLPTLRIPRLQPSAISGAASRQGAVDFHPTAFMERTIHPLALCHRLSHRSQKHHEYGLGDVGLGRFIPRAPICHQAV